MSQDKKWQTKEKRDPLKRSASRTKKMKKSREKRKNSLEKRGIVEIICRREIQREIKFIIS
jgi:hypothetical protein